MKICEFDVVNMSGVMSTVPNGWSNQLASAIAAALREYSAGHLTGRTVIAFDVGCFPWHGSIELSVLTAEELDANPALSEPGELAAWPRYNFTAELSSWTPAAELGRQMMESYRAADEEARPATVEAFLRACAAAVASSWVAEVLAALPRDPRFRVSVTHPDNGRPFWPRGKSEAETDIF